MPQWNPQDYHQHSSQQQQWAQVLLNKLTLRGDEHVLDLGCGDGKVTAQIAKAVPWGGVVGVDSSADVIAFAQQTYPTTAFGNLRFQHGDARSLSFNAEFDWVVSFACLHWVIDHRPVLMGISRSLRPGGRVILQFGGKGNAAEIVQVMNEVTGRSRWAGYFVGAEFPWGFYAPEDYRPWLEAAGLKATRLELVPKDMLHQGGDGLAGWLRTTWMPYVQRVPAELRQAFLDEVVAGYIKGHPADAEGAVHVTMIRLEVEAGKE